MLNTNKLKNLPVIFYILLLAFVLRVCVALFTNQIYNPDELFQYLEQAHQLVFGYGYVPWEYRFGIRSWLFPMLISIPLYLCKFVGLDKPTFYVPFIKIIFCLISLSSVYLTYAIGRNLKNKKVGLYAAFFVAIWYELIYFAHKATPDIVVVYVMIYCLYLTTKTVNKKNMILFGFFSALVLIIRLQYLPALGILYLVLFFKHFKNLKLYFKLYVINAAVFLLTIFVFVGLLDYITWSKFFASAYNNYLFNKVYNVSSDFGTAPYYYYYYVLQSTSLKMFLISLIVGLIFIKRTYSMLLLILALVISHSYIPHKEYRFILLAIPLYFLILAFLFEKIKFKFLSYFLIVVIFTISVFGSLQKLPEQHYAYQKSIWKTDEILKIYLYLSQKNNVKSILVTEPEHCFNDGGYYYLHKNVPILAPYNSPIDKDDGLELRNYFSHLVYPIKYKNIPHFKTTKKYKELKIRRAKEKVTELKSFDFDPRQVMTGYDNKYTPNVTPFINFNIPFKK